MAIDNITLSRIDTLHPKIRQEVKDIYLNEVVPALTNITCRFAYTLRTFQEQDALYAQGRTKLYDTNGKKLGIVTKAKGGQSIHNYGLACFDDTTKIVTNNGVKLFKDLTDNDEVLTFKEGLLNWEKPLAYINYDYDGEMVKVKTRSVDLLVTPNHKMIVSEKNYKNEFGDWCEITADDLSQRHRIPTAGMTNHKDNFIPDLKKYNVGIEINDSLSWYEFIGYYLSEGSSCGVSDGIMREHSGRYKVSIYQSKEKNNHVYNKIKKCLDKLDIIYFADDIGFHIHNKGLWEYLFPLGNSHQKRIPKKMFYADYEHLSKLYYALIDGDGSYYKTHEAYFSVNKELSEDVATLMLLLNKSVSIIERKPNENNILPHGEKLQKINNQYQTNSRGKNTHELRNGSGGNLITRENYKGVVYCVTTPSGSVVIERNGKFAIAGNCDIVLLVNGGASWDDVKDFDKDGKPDWMEVINIYKRHGYTWGGDWKFKDSPHLEKTGYDWRTLLAKHNAGDFIPGTRYVNI